MAGVFRGVQKASTCWTLRFCALCRSRESSRAIVVIAGNEIVSDAANIPMDLPKHFSLGFESQVSRTILQRGLFEDLFVFCGFLDLCMGLFARPHDSPKLALRLPWT